MTVAINDIFAARVISENQELYMGFEQQSMNSSNTGREWVLSYVGSHQNVIKDVFERSSDFLEHGLVMNPKLLQKGLSTGSEAYRKAWLLSLSVAVDQIDFLEVVGVFSGKLTIPPERNGSASRDNLLSKMGIQLEKAESLSLLRKSAEESQLFSNDDESRSFWPDSLPPFWNMEFRVEDTDQLCELVRTIIGIKSVANGNSKVYIPFELNQPSLEQLAKIKSKGVRSSHYMYQLTGSC